MITMTIIFIIAFIFGIFSSMIIGLFIMGIGENNKKQEYYHEGFIDGYTQAKEEKK